MPTQEAVFPTRVVSTVVAGNTPAAPLFACKDWTYCQFVAPSGNGNLYVSFGVPINAKGSPTLVLVGGTPYNWLLPPDTRVFVASDGAAGTTLRLDMLITPSPLQERLLASWNVMSREIVDVLLAKLIGVDLYTRIKNAVKPTRVTEKKPREGIYDGLLDVGGRP